MALLETFQILFTSDAREVEKGAEDAEKALEEVEQKTEEVDEATKTLGQSFTAALTSAQGTLAGLLSIGAITAGVISEAAKTDELGKFAQTLGLNIEEVDAWGEAVVRSGGSAEGFRGSVSGLQDSLTEMALTGSGPAAETFARLGISAVDAGGQIKSAFDLLPEIAESFEGLSEAESVSFGQALGLDQSTILLLQQGKVSVDELIARQKELGVTTQEDYETAALFNNAWADTSQVFGDLTRKVGTALLPAFTAILKGLESVFYFLRDNKELVVGFFVGAALAITAAYLPAIVSAAAATLVAIAPFVAIGLAITAVGAAFALVYDDIQTFLAGGKSATGEIIEFFQGMATSITETMTELKDWLTGIFDSMLGGINSFLETLGGVFDAAKKFLGFEGEEPEIQKTTRKTFIINGQVVDEDTYRAMEAAEQQVERINESPLVAAQGSGLASTANNINRNTSVSVGAVNVDARGGNSEEIASGVGSALKDQMQTTVSNYDDGVII